jgi:hypothetical protein
MDKDGNTISAANFKDYYYWMADSETSKPVKVSSIYIDTSTETLGVGYHR